ncbi:MAG: L-seryl-tRNA(Sec) selenium transferase [Anaerolineaceae bacterium]|nr:L-seryl-tRNA(Sec) selenium transferase [Anaerolineaceae bacterium]
MEKVDFSAIPSVDAILQSAPAYELINTAGRKLTVKAIRQTLDHIREEARGGLTTPDIKTIINRAGKLISLWLKPSLLPVINASGIILHTNLGRAPLSIETVEAMHTISISYNNLEFDLNKGKRGKRDIHAETILQELTGAESALVVNNNAAAVLLILSALAKRKKVIIPHSQLVEIGGGFRIPDVMRQSGAKLIAIGTTNRIHISDYKNALEEGAALVLNAHHSNFKIIGFTAEPKLEEIAIIAHKHSVPFIFDQGSGAMLDTSDFGLAHEPTIQEAVQAGIDLICFSGDKLLGGPQAGIIIGRADLLYKIKHYPLARAVRADKTCLAGISATLTHYLKGEAIEKIPIWRMITQNIEELHERAKNWQKQIKKGSVIKGNSMVGGGSLPGESLPTYLLALNVPKSNQFMARLRSLPLPIIARIKEKQVLFDPRTVLPNQEEMFLSKLMKVLQKKNGGIGEHSNEKRS